MSKIERFEEIKAWEKARVLVKEIYRVTSTGRFSKDFSLREQLRRAAVSIVSNTVHPVKYVGQGLFHGAGGSPAKRTGDLCISYTCRKGRLRRSKPSFTWHWILAFSVKKNSGACTT